MNKLWILALAATASANAFADRGWHDDCDDGGRHHHWRDRPAVVYQQPQVIYQAPPVVYPAPQVVYQDRIVYRDQIGRAHV